MRSRLHLVMPLLVTPLLTQGCSARVSPEAIPYQFRQSMIEPDEPEVAPAPARRERPRRKVREVRRSRGRSLRSCRHLAGRRYGSQPHHRAVAAMLRACLGREVSLTAIGRDEDALRRSDPLQGDLVLFHNTRDANRNHKLDDRFSDVGVVVGVRGTLVTFVYVRRGRARQGVLNLEAPHRRRRTRRARVENTFLRVKLPADPPGTRYLAGQLFAGFSTTGS
jgi:hypothetical protein